MNLKPTVVLYIFALRKVDRCAERKTAQAAPDLIFEKAFWSCGIDLIAGIDEVGRGALAGPVTAAVLVLPVDRGLPERLAGVRDSKSMTATARANWAGRLKDIALEWQVGCADSQEIDELGIVQSTYMAMQRALVKLKLHPQHLLIDYLELPGCTVAQTSLVKGDGRAFSIAGASILAKVERDEWMVRIENQYPQYGFSKNKGYGTKAHRKAIARHGLSSIHRKSFKIKSIMDKQ